VLVGFVAAEKIGSMHDAMGQKAGSMDEGLQKLLQGNYAEEGDRWALFDGAPEGAPFCEVHETHAGVVILLGNRALKFKKPVKFEFLDFSTPAMRRQALRRELELNRRLSPTVYLDVLELTRPDGTPLEPVLEMRRLPSERSLEHLARRGQELSCCLGRLADKLVEFHRHCASSAEDRRIGEAAKPERLLALWEENMAVCRRLRDLPIEQGSVPYTEAIEQGSVPYTEAIEQGLVPDIDVIEEMARLYIEGRRALFDRRIAEGEVRDGHGDLLAADVFCVDEDVYVLDCIEFDDELRFCDVASEIAFLAMDLERLGRPEAARSFALAYAQKWPGKIPFTLFEHFVSYRASVRAKVAVLALEQGAPNKAPEAIGLIQICARHAAKAVPSMVLLGGVPGTGKTTLAEELSQADSFACQLAKAPRFEVIRSDVVRKELAGMSPKERSSSSLWEGIYSKEFTERTYRTLIERACRYLAEGTSVILDATWSAAWARREARAAGKAAKARVVELVCVAPPDVVAERIARRQALRSDASEADETVAKAIAERFDPWPEAVEINTATEMRQAVEAALRAIDGH
jgi:aminoglycoside phosphotransferase family enzyme/predicted kinase